MPTFKPAFLAVKAKLKATDDLPTPPLPEATATKYFTPFIFGFGVFFSKWNDIIAGKSVQFFQAFFIAFSQSLPTLEKFLGILKIKVMLF